MDFLYRTAGLYTTSIMPGFFLNIGAYATLCWASAVFRIRNSRQTDTRPLSPAPLAAPLDIGYSLLDIGY